MSGRDEPLKSRITDAQRGITSRLEGEPKPKKHQLAAETLLQVATWPSRHGPTATRIAYTIVSPPIVAVAALTGHAVDEIRENWLLKMGYEALRALSSSPVGPRGGSSRGQPATFSDRDIPAAWKKTGRIVVPSDVGRHYTSQTREGTHVLYE